MDPLQQNKDSERDIAIKKELKRRSNDLIRINNIMDEDHVSLWDGFRHVFPANSSTDKPRYIAMKALKEITDKILIKEMHKAVKEENERRVSSGQKEMDPQERETFETRNYRLNDPERRRPLIKKIWGGVVEEFGRDQTPPEPEQDSRDHRPIDQQLIEELEDMPAVEEVADAQVESGESLEDLHIGKLRSKAKKQGIDFNATDKKEQLISKISEGSNA